MKLPLSLIQYTIRDALDETAVMDTTIANRTAGSVMNTGNAYRLVGRPVFYHPGEIKGDLVICGSGIPPEAWIRTETFRGTGARVHMENGMDKIWICRCPDRLIEQEMAAGRRESNDPCPSTGKKEFRRQLPDNILLLRPDIDSTFISDRIHALFSHWEEWDLEMHQMVVRRASISDFLTAAAKLSGHPLNIMNTEFCIEAFSDGWNEAVGNTEIPPLDLGGRLPTEIVNIYKNDPVYLQCASDRKPFLYENKAALPEKVLCANIFIEEIYCARIVMFECGRQFRPWDIYLMEKLADALSLVYQSSAEFPDDIRRLENTVRQMIHGERVSQKDLWDLLAGKNWGEQDHYQLGLIAGTNQDTANNTLDFFRYQLSREFSYCLSLKTGGRILILLNLTCAPKTFHGDFATFIREGNFRVGFSNPFTGFTRLDVFFREAEIALQKGSSHDETIWMHSFEELAFSYFLRKGCEEIPADQIRAPELRQLEDYDASHGTELVNTLRIYLSNELNASKTASDLCIQRGTLIYRISRIRKLTGLNLNDWRRIMYIGLSFLLEDENA